MTHELLEIIEHERFKMVENNFMEKMALYAKALNVFEVNASPAVVQSLCELEKWHEKEFKTAKEQYIESIARAATKSPAFQMKTLGCIFHTVSEEDVRNSLMSIFKHVSDFPAEYVGTKCFFDINRIYKENKKFEELIKAGCVAYLFPFM